MAEFEKLGLESGCSFFRALEVCRNTQQEAMAASDAHMQARATFGLMECLRRVGRVREAGDEFSSLLKMLSINGDVEALSWALWSESNRLRQQCKFASSNARLEQALAIGRRHRLWKSVAYVQAGLAENARIADCSKEAYVLHTAALSWFGESRDLRGQAWALEGLGQMQLLSGDGAAAARLFQEAESLSEAINETRSLAFAKRCLAEAALVCGDLELAKELGVAGWKMFEETGYVTGMGYAALSLGRIATIKQCYDEAEQWLDVAAEIFRRNADKRGMAYVKCAVASCCLKQGNIARSTVLIEDSARFFETAGIAYGTKLAGLVRHQIATRPRTPAFLFPFAGRK